MLLKSLPKKKFYGYPTISGNATGGGGGGFTPTSTQSANFLARTAGLTDPQKTLYDAMITGVVTDLGGSTASSTWPILDALWITAAPDRTTAKLNLVNSSFGLTEWRRHYLDAANAGYTGNGSSMFVDTGFFPATSGTNFISASSSIGSYINASRTAVDSSVSIGTGDSNGFLYQQIIDTGPIFKTTVNSTSNASATNTEAKGAWISSRDQGLSTISVYKNASTVFISSQLAAFSGGFSTFNVYLLGFNSNTPSNFSSDRIGAAFIGGSLTSTQAFALNARINTFLTAAGNPAY